MSTEPSTQHPREPREISHSRLNLWLSKLPNHVMPLNMDLAQQVVNEIYHEDSTSESLATLIQQDPALCLKLYLKASRQLKDRDGNIQGLIHLIGLLGTEQIKHVIRDAPKKQAPSDGQKELLSASLFAAVLAYRLLPKKHGTRAERFFLPALLFNAPLWLMWSAAPKLMNHGQQLASKKQKPLKPLCEETLGFSLQALLEKTQLFLPLPDLTLKALAIDYQKNIDIWKKARHLSHENLKEWTQANNHAKKILYSPEVGISMINHYVLAIYLDWNGKHIIRWSKLLANHLGITEDDLHKMVVTIANELHSPKNALHERYTSGRFSPLYRYRQLHKAMPADQPTSNGMVIQHYLNELRTSTKADDCVQLAMEALREGVKAERCIMIKIDKRHLLLPRDEKGDEVLRVDIADCGPMFAKLIKKPTAITIEKAQLPLLRAQLPIPLTRLWQPHPCGLMSLFHDGHPYALVICDHKHWSREHQQYFKAIGKQLVQTLNQCEIR